MTTLIMVATIDYPVTIVTKSQLVTRDLDLLAPLAKLGLAKVCLSIATLNPKLVCTMEPRAATKNWISI